MNSNNKARTVIGMAVSLAVLAGCAEEPLSVYTSSKAHDMATENLCVVYHRLNSSSAMPAADIDASKQAVRAELTARNEVPQSEWRDINDKFMEKGLHRCAVWAILGEPERVNAVHGHDAVEEIWHYGKDAYVHLFDGKVTAYQLSPTG